MFGAKDRKIIQEGLSVFSGKYKQNKKSIKKRIKDASKERVERTLNRVEKKFEDYLYNRLVEEFEKLLKEK